MQTHCTISFLGYVKARAIAISVSNQKSSEVDILIQIYGLTNWPDFQCHSNKLCTFEGWNYP